MNLAAAAAQPAMRMAAAGRRPAAAAACGQQSLRATLRPAASARRTPSIASVSHITGAQTRGVIAGGPEASGDTRQQVAAAPAAAGPRLPPFPPNLPPVPGPCRLQQLVRQQQQAAAAAAIAATGEARCCGRPPRPWQLLSCTCTGQRLLPRVLAVCLPSAQASRAQPCAAVNGSTSAALLVGASWAPPCPCAAPSAPPAASGVGAGARPRRFRRRRGPRGSQPRAALALLAHLLGALLPCECTQQACCPGAPPCMHPWAHALSCCRTRRALPPWLCCALPARAVQRMPLPPQPLAPLPTAPRICR